MRIVGIPKVRSSVNAVRVLWAIRTSNVAGRINAGRMASFARTVKRVTNVVTPLRIGGIGPTTPVVRVKHVG